MFPVVNAKMIQFLILSKINAKFKVFAWFQQKRGWDTCVEVEKEKGEDKIGLLIIVPKFIQYWTRNWRLKGTEINEEFEF